MSLLEMTLAAGIGAILLIAGVDRWNRITLTAEFRSDWTGRSAGAHAWHRQHCATFDLLDDAPGGDAEAASTALLANLALRRPDLWQAFWRSRESHTLTNVLRDESFRRQWAVLWLRHTLPPPADPDHGPEKKRQLWLRGRGGAETAPGVVEIQPEAPAPPRRKGHTDTQRILWGEAIKC